MERKLTAIFSADVKGYSRLMGEDEEATIRMLTTYREVMTILVQQHRGRVVDAPGDNLLAEFASAVDAVQGAVAMQRELRTRNTELPGSRKMEYRIGINVGDVVVEGERIYGDGVNIAARLESLAEGGGICISGTVYDQIEHKLALAYEYLGEQPVKNITKPVRVYRIKLEPEVSAVNTDESQEADKFATPSRAATQKRQREDAASLSLQGNTQWLPRRLRLPLRSLMAFLTIVAVILSVAYFSKALAIRNSSRISSGAASRPLQDQQVVRTGETAASPPQAERHRGFETPLPQGQRIIPLTDKVGRRDGAYTESHALVVGISNHTGGWPSLPGVKKDVKTVAEALGKHGFHVVVVMDPNLVELEGAYRDFIGKYGLAPDNRLLFYFAGSSYTAKPAYALGNQEDGMGYLVTRDTPRPTDLDSFRSHALSMERFVSMAREIQTKHVLFVFDSCFSGAIAFALARSPSGPPESEITQRTNEPVRQFISAGTAAQKVPDESIFRRFFIEAIEENSEADRNGDGYVTGSELGQFLQEKVTIASQGMQTPQYGKMFDPRLNRGEFVFAPSLTAPSPTIATLHEE